MDKEKQLIIHFNNGAKMEVSFPTQIKDSIGALVDINKRILGADKLIIQTGGKTLVIPWTSVQYIEAGALPSAALPVEAIKGAKVVESKQ